MNRKYRLLAQLVSVTVLTCRKEARNKRKLFSIDGKFFWASENKVFLPKKEKNGFASISVTVSTCRKKKLNKRKRFPQTESASLPYGLANCLKIGKLLSLEGVSHKWEK